jgi:AcrR family transcriptional regulator
VRTSPTRAGDLAASSHWLRRRAAIGLSIERAALKLFLQRGTDNVTVMEIAEAAGISRRTFFRYFQSKDEILAAMPRRALNRASQAVCERPARESIIDALVATSRDKHLSSGDDEIMRLSGKVMARSPQAWSRALGRLRSATDQIFTRMLANRLRLAGRNEAGADVIGVALAAIVTHVYRAWVNEGCVGEFADLLEHGLQHLTKAGLPAQRMSRR